MPKLTKRTVDGLEPELQERIIWDSELRGLGLRVKPTGRKTYVLQYRNRRRQSRRLTLGKHGTLTPDLARKMARQLLVEVDQGSDPSVERRAEQSAPTMDVLAERYLEEYASQRKKPASIQADRRMWQNHVLPVLGQHRVGEITREDIAQLHYRLRTMRYQANRVLALLSKAFNLAEMWGWRPDHSNPCRHVERYKERRRERFLSAEELQWLGAALNVAERLQSEHPSAILAIRLLLLTGARKQEILRLRWEEVDWKNSYLRLADSKTGQKVIPLGPPALDLLRQTPQKAENPFVCTGYRAGQSFVGLQRPWKRISAAAGLDGVRVHDLRHTHASVGIAAGLSLPIIGKLLGHTQPATTARYAHLADDPRQQAATLIAGEIAEGLGLTASSDESFSDPDFQSVE